jgi:hypothetical protein
MNYLLLSVFVVMIVSLILWALLYRVHRPSSDAAMGTTAACLGILFIYMTWNLHLTGEVNLPFRHSSNRLVYREHEPLLFYAILAIFGAFGTFLTAVIPASIWRLIKRVRSRTP